MHLSLALPFLRLAQAVSSFFPRRDHAGNEIEKMETISTLFPCPSPSPADTGVAQEVHVYLPVCAAWCAVPSSTQPRNSRFGYFNLRSSNTSRAHLQYPLTQSCQPVPMSNRFVSLRISCFAVLLSFSFSSFLCSTPRPHTCIGCTWMAFLQSCSYA